MSYPFNADEIFEIAEQIEVNGGKFYRRAAASFDKEETRNLLKGLARMEDLHKVTFGEIRENLSTPERQPTVYDPYDEAVLYLRAFAGGHVFKVDEDVDAFFNGTETLEDILHKAVRFEKDSIVFYVGIPCQRAEPPQGRATRRTPHATLCCQFRDKPQLRFWDSCPNDVTLELTATEVGM